MKLCDLFLGIINNIQLPSIELFGLASNSGKIKPGYLFVLLSKQAKYFIPQAISNGAIATLSNDVNIDSDVIHIYHPRPREIYHQLASRFYSQQPERIVAVTGTNGKTSVVNFYQQLLSSSKIKAVSIGTIGVKGIATKGYNTNLTTPDAADIHCILHDLSLQKIEDVAIEASSHGLEQHRMHSVKVKAAAFTNLSHDHFDYHDSYQSYFAAKQKLFTEVLSKDGVAVLNADSPEYNDLLSLMSKKNVISYGKHAHDIKLIKQIAHDDGQSIIFSINQVKREIRIPVLGMFQSYNILCALGLMMAVGHDVVDLENLRFVEGRMQLVKKDNYRVVIDYAHTPDALKSALISLKWHANFGRLILVFGCGGNRDQQKRVIMGRIAHDYANIIIVCDDNPRNEDPSNIRKEIISGCPNAIEIGDRQEAIIAAIDMASPKDIILVAGKGHENKQIFSNKTVFFNDLLIINEILSGE